MVELDAARLEPDGVYKLLIGSVVPRPIAFRDAAAEGLTVGG